MKKKLIIVMCLALALLAGCGQEEEIPKLLNVDLTVDPTKAERDEPVTFKAKVTYGEEEVKDADDVSYPFVLLGCELDEEINPIMYTAKEWQSYLVSSFLVFNF